MRAPPPFVTEVFPGRDPSGRRLVSVLCKRTYTLASNGRYRHADEQITLADDGDYAERPDRAGSVPVGDPDIWPVKLATDVVVTGRVYAPGGKPARRMLASVRVGEHVREVAVVGDRAVDYTRGGIEFGEASPFEVMDQSWWRAYGGIDPGIGGASGTADLAAGVAALAPEDHPGAYPRNPCGTGFIVERDPDRLRGLALPNFEDPLRLLAPDNLCATNVTAWWKMPLPVGFGWFHPAWYPRCVAVGALPRFAPPDEREDFPEVVLGAVTRGRSKRLAQTAPEAEADLVEHRLAQGAAPGMALPFLAGDERVLIRGMSRDGELRFDLPGERPVTVVRLAGRDVPVTTVLHTLHVEPDAERFVLLWSARAYLDGDAAGEPRAEAEDDDERRDPLAGIEATVDTVPVRVFHPEG